MSSIKERITKKCHSDPRVTIDTIHSNLVNELDSSEKTSYYLDNGLLLDSYYSNDTTNVPKKPVSDTSVLSYFQISSPKEETTETKPEQNIIQDYMMNVDDTYVVNNDLVEIYKAIFEEINKNMNLDIQKIKPKQMKSILKKLGFNKYYEHIPHIINVMSGKKAPSLSRREEEQLRTLFKEIQIPFSNNCPPNRKNFLSYSYVLHKFCELLEYDYLLPYFPLLKSREKLLQQDQIWKLICADLNWQFIESI
jgi:hypothetical protein